MIFASCCILNITLYQCLSMIEINLLVKLSVVDLFKSNPEAAKARNNKKLKLAYAASITVSIVSVV